MSLSLPKDDPNPLARAAELTRAQSQWMYGTDLAPWRVSEGVPSEERPSLRWLALLAKPLARVGVNGVLNRGAWAFRTPLESTEAPIPAELAVAQTPSLARERAGHDALRELGERALRAAASDALESVESPSATSSISDAERLSLFQEVERRLMEAFVGASAESLEAFSLKGPQGRPRDLGDYAALFRAIDPPSIADSFPKDGLTDETFVRLRVAGPNPEMLECVDAVPNGFSGAQILSDGTTVADAAASQRLFIADYGMLKALVPQAPKLCWIPRALFAVNGTGRLEAVAISYDAALPAATPTTSTWEGAKHVVQVADANQHELVAHLARTHLFVESFVMATHRELAPNHPVHRLLLPHFQGTIFINDAARRGLIAKDGSVDKVFAGTINSSRGLSIEALRTMDFGESMLPDRLGARRLAKIAEYPFRDDALPTWEAIRMFVAAYVRRWYSSDTAVASDPELTRWSTLLSAPFDQGGVSGFTAPTTVDALSAALTLVVYTASAQHSAVNFPQYPDMSYSPTSSGAAWSDVLPSGVTLSGADLSFFPPLDLALQQAQLVYLLASTHYTQLGQYPRGWFGDAAIDDDLVPAFQNALRRIEVEIMAKNATRRFPYQHLRPSLVPQSINI